MDNRFPRWLQRTVHFLSFLSLPNLGPLVCGLAVLGFVGSNMLNAPMQNFVFEPEAFLAGEYWRILTLPMFFEPIWLLFFCFYSYFLFQMMEQNWGEAPTTIFTLFSYLMVLVVSLITGATLPVWHFTMENLTMALGTLFPEMEVTLFFVLPVKLKWISVLTAVVFFWQFFSVFQMYPPFLLLILPYVVFFGPVLYAEVKMRRQVARNRRRLDR